MARVKLEAVRKVYGDSSGHVAVHGVDLEVRDGEFVVLVGPSGCGKSTTLRMIAGLESISSGKLWIGDRLVNDVSPKDRDIAMVFQSYALYPHMTVFENMAFALKLKKLPTAEIDRRVRQAADILDIGGVLDRTPKQLSGGQRQRVAVGRALVREPKAFLLDEPLGALDPVTRYQLQTELKAIFDELGKTVVMVTHDMSEAAYFADDIVMMREGRVVQRGALQDLLERPADPYVHEFIRAQRVPVAAGLA